MPKAPAILSALWAVIVAGGALIALTAARPSWLSRELAGRIAGPSSECIILSQVDGPMIVDRQTILYRQGRRIWRMDLGDTCPSLREDSILIVEPRDSRLCQNDRFRTLDQSSRIPGGVCRVSPFIPYDKR